jgi:AhpD family alkylhydroperoxidase
MTQRFDYQTDAAEAMRGLGAVYAVLGRSTLAKSLLDLVFLRASQINGCAYCTDMHSRDLLRAGVPIEKVLLVAAWREAGEWFSEQERAALEWAESVTQIASTRATDAEYALVSSHFTSKEVADLTIAISLINTYNRIAIASRRPADSLRSVNRHDG